MDIGGINQSNSTDSAKAYSAPEKVATPKPVEINNSLTDKDNNENKLNMQLAK